MWAAALADILSVGIHPEIPAQPWSGSWWGGSWFHPDWVDHGFTTGPSSLSQWGSLALDVNDEGFFTLFIQLCFF